MGASIAFIVGFAILIPSACCATIPSAGTAAKADRIVIVKSTHTMMLLSRGQILKTYNVALGRGARSAKIREGDRQTPEGVYVIDAKTGRSRFHRSLHISYPNAQDRERARLLGVPPGNQIEIHGVEDRWAWLGSLHQLVDWTSGCIAVTNAEIEEIYQLVPLGTPVEIRGNAISVAGPAPHARAGFWVLGTRD